MTPAEFRHTREAMGLSLEDMARALEVTKRAVQFWETGDRAVPGPVRVALRLMSRLKRSKGGRP